MRKKHTRRKHTRRKHTRRKHRKTKLHKHRRKHTRHAKRKHHRRRTNKQYGGGCGNTSSLVGSPWIPSGGSGGQGWENATYLELNPNPGVGGGNNLFVPTRSEIPTQSVLKGGNKRKSRKHHQKGGGMFWAGDDLVNLGRVWKTGGENLFNTWSGKSSIASPLPYKDQLVDDSTVKLHVNNLKNSYDTAGSLVASI
jgi:hypothetical protein